MVNGNKKPKDYSRHYNIRSQILAEANKYSDVKLWPNPVGLGYAGEVVREYKIGIDNFIVIKNPRRVKYGLAPGSADCIGFKIEEIAGKKIARFLAIEIKSRKDALREKQSNFRKMILRLGGIAGLARSLADLPKILKTPLITQNNTE